jgi:uncharacterized protein (DUF2147 family)
MKPRNEIIPIRFLGAAMLIVATLLSILPQTFAADPTADPASHAAHLAAGTMPPDAPAAANGDPAVSQQLSELQAKVAQLEAALGNASPTMAAAPAGAAMAGMSGAVPAASPSMGMDKMRSGGQMGGMPVMGGGSTPGPAMAGMAPTGAPPAGAMNMMAMMDKMMGMMDKMMPMAGGSMAAAASAPAMPSVGNGMEKMGMEKMEMAEMMGKGTMGSGTGAAMPQSVLPGFPGASHLYHIGATDFFLDHSQHITLSTEQTAALNKAKEQALLAKSAADRGIAQAEQELWTLTASDQPNATTVEIKIREIANRTGDARLAFIRSVGEASKLLSDGQRKSLTGFAPPSPATLSGGVVPPAGAMPMKNM